MNTCTYIIPLKVDSQDRVDNTLFLLRWYKKIGITNVVIVEMGNNFELSEEFDFVTIIRLEDELVNHRTKLVNEVLKIIKTPYACINDADIFLEENYYKEAELYLYEGYNVVYPWNSQTNNMHHRYSKMLDFTFDKVGKDFDLLYNFAKGAIFWVDVNFFKSIGGENENFIAWGCEDEERFDRMNKFGNVFILKTVCWHLDHFRTQNESRRSEHYGKNIKELEKVKAMSLDDTRKYIDSWPWYKQLMLTI